MKEPDGELTIRVLAMPEHTNPSGDIFGGWLVSQMDLAAFSIAAETAKSRVTTVAIDHMNFISSVRVGDFVCCYVRLLKTGRTSMQIKVEAWAYSPYEDRRRQVTHGVFTFVAIDGEGRPVPVKK